MARLSNPPTAERKQAVEMVTVPFSHSPSRGRSRAVTPVRGESIQARTGCPPGISQIALTVQVINRCKRQALEDGNKCRHPDNKFYYAQELFEQHGRRESNHPLLPFSSLLWKCPGKRVHSTIDRTGKISHAPQSKSDLSQVKGYNQCTLASPDKMRLIYIYWNIHEQ